MATDSSADTHKYTVVEQGNITLGQAGVAFLDDTDTYTPPDNMVVVAIQFSEDSVFDDDDATSAESDWPTENQGGPGTNSEAIGSTTMPQGMTIYGRWKTVALDSGSAFLYLGP